jgi:succinate dehydrogenase flavin-adding protein (antitoxin of CptAB toxin-antitoxin module)
MHSAQKVSCEILIKRLRFRAHHRGTKEADLLVAAYVERVLESAPQGVFGCLEDFLRLDDQALVDILSGVAPWPKAFKALRRYSACDKKLM